MIALKLLEPKTCELKVKGDVFDLFVAIGTLGSSLSMILRASAKLDWVTSIYISIKKYIKYFWVEISSKVLREYSFIWKKFIKYIIK
jgi:hypothetical protein